VNPMKEAMLTVGISAAVPAPTATLSPETGEPFQSFGKVREVKLDE
jgi:hypothetical protein